MPVTFLPLGGLTPKQFLTGLQVCVEFRDKCIHVVADFGTLRRGDRIYAPRRVDDGQFESLHQWRSAAGQSFDSEGFMVGIVPTDKPRRPVPR